MGRVYAFECLKCGLRARVAGGLDRGVNCFAHTMVCHDCRRLFDAVTHLRLLPGARPQAGARASAPLPVESKPALPDHLHVSDRIVNDQPVLPEPHLVRSKSIWVQLSVQCPSNSTHRVEPWKRPWRCPICQSFLEWSFVPFRIWD